MNYIGVFIALLIIATGIILQINSQKRFIDFEKLSPQNLTQNRSKFSPPFTSTSSPPTSSNINQNNNSSSQTNINITQDVSGATTNNSSVPKIDLNSFRYPSSNQLKMSDTEMELESTDNPDTITNWYKDKVRSLSLTANSVVTTSNNQNVLNKIVASENQTQVEVNITRLSQTNKTEIRVILK